MHTHTNPWGRLKWPYAITRLTSHFVCGLMSDLVIWKFRKSMVILVHDTKCPYWNQVSLNNTNPTLTCTLQLDNSVERQHQQLTDEIGKQQLKILCLNEILCQSPCLFTACSMLGAQIISAHQNAEAKQHKMYVSYPADSLPGAQVRSALKSAEARHHKSNVWTRCYRTHHDPLLYDKTLHKHRVRCSFTLGRIWPLFNLYRNSSFLTTPLAVIGFLRIAQMRSGTTASVQSFT